jgi:hypothetical protein
LGGFPVLEESDPGLRMRVSPTFGGESPTQVGNGGQIERFGALLVVWVLTATGGRKGARRVGQSGPRGRLMPSRRAAAVRREGLWAWRKRVTRPSFQLRCVCHQCGCAPHS